MNFDIAAMEQATTAKFEVEVGVRDDGEKVGFVVVGPGSEQFAKAEREIQILNIKEAAQRKSNLLDMTKDEDAAVIADGADRRRMLLVDNCVVDWFGFTDQGKPAAYSVERLHRVLKAKPTWVDKLLFAIEDERNFNKG